MTMRLGAANGVALVLALLVMLMMSALGAAFVLVTSSEAMIAGNFRSGQEGTYAARAAAERALADLAIVGDWNGVLGGTVRSTFVDGLPAGSRTLTDGSSVDLSQIVNLANCRKTSACTAAEMDAVTAERPHGPNNPRWQPYAYGRLADVGAAGAVDSPYYVLVLAGDDPSEIDGDPLHDGTGASLGAGVLALRVEALGPRGAHKTIGLSVARASPTGIRVLSWRY